MHIVLGFLGTIVTILILLNRLTENGIDIGWLNPFAWQRRRAWAKKYSANPAYAVTGPMEATALAMVAIAKGEGDISAEQKRELKRMFQEAFHLNDDESTSLLASSIFLLKDIENPHENMGRLLDASKNSYTEEQAESAVSLITQVANIEGEASPAQLGSIQSIRKSFGSLCGETQ